MAEAEKKSKQSRCRGPNCRAVLIWREHNGKMRPFEENGADHFLTCPDRDLFRGGGIKTKKSDIDRY